MGLCFYTYLNNNLNFIDEFYFVFYFADGLNKESNANIYVFYSEKKWVMFCFVLFGIMLFLLLIAHIVLSIIQCPSGNRK